MPYVTAQDGTQIYYKDWGNKGSQPVVFSHGWPLSSDDWENQMFFLAENGYRAIAHDRRGHGRSSQPWDGNDMDTYADDLNTLFEELDLKDVMMVGHSTGGGEVTRFLGRHGSKRVSKAVLVGAVPPLLVKSEKSPDGVPLEVFDSFRDALKKDRAKFFIDVPSGPFFGFNRTDATVSQGKIWSWWQQGMACGFKNAYDCVKAFSETDFTEDLQGIDIPVLVLHGDDDQVVPIDASARKTIKLLKKGTLKELPGAPHALPTICVDEVNEELLKFLRS
ncbi:alpha/beta hydrolase fold protein [Polychaeton citri CBS 116435]|uniref:Alpha/beta hydrolase fold protein n=1 Tax=Polychaeton citri CBS 116435 TaxID=1314669 RepID=A0A9P4UNC5_9PEZI|nr:alpha/beta hydrolase fold protein [Polychaeton citri CBS 116435]